VIGSKVPNQRRATEMVKMSEPPHARLPALGILILASHCQRQPLNEFTP
jgi:hypothetical protein